MADNRRHPMASGASIACRRTLRSFHERERNSHWDGVAEEEATSNEATEDIPHQPHSASPNSLSPPGGNNMASSASQTPLLSYFAPQTSEASSSLETPARARTIRSSQTARGRRRTDRDSAFDSNAGSPLRDTMPDLPYMSDYELALQYDLLDEDADDDELLDGTEDEFGGNWYNQSQQADDEDLELRELSTSRSFGQQPTQPSAGGNTHRSFHHPHLAMAGSSDPSQDRYGSVDERDITRNLHGKGAVAVMLYNNTSPNPEANDIWPECRSSAKLPARYFLLGRNRQVPDRSRQGPFASTSNPSQSKRKEKGKGRRKGKATTTELVSQDEAAYELHPTPTAGRPEWKLPVELVELVAEYLNRDDIKALRLVSREMNHNISQVIFQTVVVPFNTEIYGMLGQETKPDLKGKRRAKIATPRRFWKNANGDEVYNGHGLDVFRGFGKHIRKYGMSFEVNEDSLAAPPVKALTETKTSFWGVYDWPFEEYRRFDAVAGLETAADETPRMKTAFSELKKVRELALSVDSGLGWLSGPDRSIRARVLQRPPQVFGTNKPIPDRRAQAQQELWNYIEACHQTAGSDVRLATLYKIDEQHSLSELGEASMMAEVQPEMPFLDPQLIHEATPYDTADIQVPSSFDDPYVLDRFVTTPPSSETGVLFSSTMPPSDAAQLMNPIIPANLTKAQKEWLLETEWAQRAFMSSYMLSVIDNPTTFNLVHTLNVSGISDRYLVMLNRPDLWDALPSLKDVTIMVIPGWRTVHKDEAGFVETPKINPTRAVNSFSELLRSQIVDRPNICNLTIGWTTGGENAEGIHARNKLLFPTPIMGLDIHADNGAAPAIQPLTETDHTRLGASLLLFPHIEQLTLKNCWVTPPALLQFVQGHDSQKLKYLVLDSVSLTALLRPIANAQQANAAPVAGHVPINAIWNAMNQNMGLAAHYAPNHLHFLQVYINTLQLQLHQMLVNAGGVLHHHQQITALQNQLQQQLTQLQNNQTFNLNHFQQHQQQNAVQAPSHNQGQAHIYAHAPAQASAPTHVQPQAQHHQQVQPFQLVHNVTNIAAQIHNLQTQIAAGQQLALPPTNQPFADAQSALLTQPREGSWVSVIDQISPGTNLSDFESVHSKADNERVSSLRSIEFISCGYAKLPHAPFEQPGIDTGNGLAAALRSPMFLRRQTTLAPAMLAAKFAHLGEIVQEVQASEFAALDAGWNLRTGWDDVEEARAVEFDGLLPGGTGRFTGIIRQSDRVVDEASARW